MKKRFQKSEYGKRLNELGLLYASSVSPFNPGDLIYGKSRETGGDRFRKLIVDRRSDYQKKLAGQILEESLPLVRFVAKELIFSSHEIRKGRRIKVIKDHKNYDIEDLVNEGAQAIIDNLSKYDLVKGSFSTYMVPRISGFMARYAFLNKEQVSVPVNLNSIVLKVERDLDEGEDLLKNISEALSELTGGSLDRESASYLYHLVKGKSLEVDRPAIDEGDNTSWRDKFLECERDLPDEISHRRILAEKTREVIRSLDDKESELISMKYGIGRKRMSRKEVMKEMGINKDKYQQIKKRAFKKLSNSSLRDLFY